MSAALFVSGMNVEGGGGWRRFTVTFCYSASQESRMSAMCLSYVNVKQTILFFK